MVEKAGNYIVKKRIVSLLLLSFMFFPVGIPEEKEEPAEVQVIVEPVEVAEEKEFFFDVPLEENLQKHIFKECEIANIAPEIVISMIEQESSYNADTVGDGGKSVGLLQVQEMWHQERMERLGCTDLTDPYQNVTVAVDFLLELFQKNEDVYWVLMAYNGGQAYADRQMEKNQYSEYALEVSERAMKLERERE